jgi:hypothetical protein
MWCATVCACIVGALKLSATCAERQTSPGQEHPAGCVLKQKLTGLPATPCAACTLVYAADVLLSQLPQTERPVIPFSVKATAVPRTTRQKLLEKLAGQYLVLALHQRGVRLPKPSVRQLMPDVRCVSGLGHYRVCNLIPRGAFLC